MIFFTACLVSAARGRRNVRLALQIAIDDIIRDRYTPSVLEGLQVTADAVTDGLDESAIRIEQQIAIDTRIFNSCRTSLTI